MWENGRYEFIRHLGTGGTAEVDLVRDTETGRTLAAKYARTDIPESIEQFRAIVAREHALLSGHRFPGLVRAYGFDSRIVCTFLEFCSGETLDRIPQVEDPILLANVLSALALDLEYIHTRGMIHGDFKPQNVFLPKDWRSLADGTRLFVKISDLSLGRRVDEPEAMRLGLGTVGFMAPETLADKLVSPQSDLFALGVVAYQLATGRHPFMDEVTDPVKVSSRTREYDPEPPQAFNGRLPRELSDLILGLMAKDSGERPSSSWEVCERLAACGATYPYRELLKPQYLVSGYDEFGSALSRSFAADNRTQTELRSLTLAKLDCLRLVVARNFPDRLSYEGGKFAATDSLHLPPRVERLHWQTLSALTFATKRQLVTAAIVGSAESARRLGFGEASAKELPTWIRLLRPRLSDQLIARRSQTLAVQAEERECFDVAARLYIQANDWESAERTARDAALRLAEESKSNLAVDILSEVLSFGQRIGKTFETRFLLRSLGEVHTKQGELNSALADYGRLIELYEGQPADKALAEAYKARGDVQRQRQNIDEALADLERTKKTFQELGDDLEYSHTLNNIGNVHFLVSNQAEALRSYRTAFHIQRRLEAEKEIASTLSNIASVYCLGGRVVRGIRLLEKSLELKKQLGDPGEIARTLNNLGYAYHMIGQPAKAAEVLKESLGLNRRIGSKKEVLFNLENLTQLMVTAGQLKESLKFFREALELAERADDQPHLAIFNMYMSAVLKRMGRIREAVAALQRCRETLKSIDDSRLVHNTDIQEFSLRYLLGDKATAVERLTSLCERIRSAKEVGEELECLLLLTRMSSSPEHYVRGKEMAESGGMHRELALFDFARAEYLVDNDDAASAGSLLEPHFTSVMTTEDELELPWMANICGRFYLAQQDIDNAQRFFGRAQSLAQRNSSLFELIQSAIGLGKVAWLQSDVEAAYHSYRQALEYCKTVMASIDDEGDRATFQSQPHIVALVTQIKELTAQIK